ncbi:PREDICTED: solute carrier family 2, facilitated glucose transporter member 9-like [Poecilia mexicana]|uniref:solute carrier family 2, facilitated glucose transporter member 9-like n=1 Tax=Poecilia mexicana TaxID=48701 RepID=UPI00072E430E|nr:PREDICTED: solute carrier family 2, facilitated glucose transporter member 9-like [Poecilia mexicana]XP_014857969.1 PREDICTED: solute carrier family 2, facilitated glucose transporter member 9-like [Poecilia mexicana]
METFFHQLTQGNALLVIIVLGCGGSFHSGYHVTGLSSPSPYIQHFINSSWYDRYKEPPGPQKVTMIWSLIVSMYAVGGLFGAASVKLFSRKLGSKRAMICNSLISVMGAVIMLTSKTANSFEMIIVARMLYGYSAGLGWSLHSMYLGEISPRKIRGRVTLTLATFNSLGKLSGQFFGLSEILGRRDLWNIVLCVPVCFSAVQALVLPFLPEAPRYLFIEKRDDKACKRALQSLWGKGDYKQEMEEMLIEHMALEASPPKSPLRLMRDRTVRWQLITTLVVFSCNQMSGMSAINTFSFDIFLNSGVPKDKIRYVTLGLGITEILTSISCSLLIEHMGRRPLFWGGYAVISAIWIMATVLLNLKDLSWAPYVVTSLIFLFIISFCGGPGAATATLSSELFIQSDCVAAFVLMGLQRWFMSAMVGLIFPFIIDAFGSYCFTLFAIMSLLGSFYTFFLLPETKGKTLVDISEEFKAITVCGKSFLERERVETKL